MKKVQKKKYKINTTLGWEEVKKTKKLEKTQKKKKIRKNKKKLGS